MITTRSTTPQAVKTTCENENGSEKDSKLKKSLSYNVTYSIYGMSE